MPFSQPAHLQHDPPGEVALVLVTLLTPADVVLTSVVLTSVTSSPSLPPPVGVVTILDDLLVALLPVGLLATGAVQRLVLAAREERLLAGGEITITEKFMLSRSAITEGGITMTEQFMLSRSLIWPPT